MGTRGRKNGISEEIREAIRKADPAIKTKQLAQQLGVSDFSVYMIRKAAGIAPTRSKFKFAKKAAPSRQPVKPAKASSNPRNKDFPDLPEHKLTHRLVPIADIPEAALSHSPTAVSIHLTFSPDQLDLIWQKFSIESKAIAITAGLQSHV